MAKKKDLGIEALESRLVYKKETRTYDIKVGDETLVYYRFQMFDDISGEVDSDEGWDGDENQRKFDALPEEVQDALDDFVCDIDEHYEK